MTAVPTERFRYWLGLNRIAGLGPRRIRRLLDRIGPPELLLTESAAALSAAGLNPQFVDSLQRPDWAAVDDDLRWLDHPGRHLLTLDDPLYPARLSAIADPPVLLFVQGEPAVLNLRQLGVVGSRNPSPGGERLAHEFSAELVRFGWTVTSGLALGIDAAAHRGALFANGYTCAVLGTGPEIVYPLRHAELADRIVAGDGALVTEFPTGVKPQAANFPRRNRIISGLSEGLLVVEAALRSGSLITAQAALEQGREVFAIPGAIQNPLSRGCNALIKQGAKLVESVQDILDEMAPGCSAPGTASGVTAADEPADPAARAILKSVAYEPTSVDTLIKTTGLTPQAVSALLLMLELDGFVVSVGGSYSRVR